jgi:hypothetical protein
VIDADSAAAELAGSWGYRLHPGEIEVRRGYDGVDVRVRRDGEYVLSIGLREPTLLPPGVVQFVSGMHPAHTPGGYRLVQCDAKHEATRSERGEPMLELFDAAAWGDDRIEPCYPLSAAVCLADVTLPRLRYRCKPDELAFTGTEPIGG